MKISFPHFQFFAILFLLLTGTKNTTGQVRSVGHDFWISCGGDQGYTYLDVIKLRITAAENSDVQIYYTANGTSTSFSMIADELKTVTLNNTLASPIQAEAIENQSVHITSTGNISMTLVAPSGVNDDAELIIPADQPNYGTVFYPVTYRVDPPSGSPLNFTIVSTCDSTVLEITPAQASVSGHPAGVPYQITLNEGQTYECGITWNLVNYAKDMTGWKVKVQNSACCNPINVYVCSPPWYIYPDTAAYACCADVWVEPVYPQESWDTVHYFVPFKYKPYDLIRILSGTNANQVYFDNVAVGTINSGEFLEAVLDAAVKIKADAPVEIMQFMVSNSVDSYPWWNGDPSLLTVTGFRDAISRTKFTTSYPFGSDTFKNVLNVVVHSSDTDILALNGVAITSGFHPYIADPAFAYTRADLDSGQIYLLECNCSFTASLYAEYSDGSFATQLQDMKLAPPPQPPLVYDADTICGVPAQLQALSGISYLWMNGSISSSITATDTGIYYVHIQLTECKDTFQFFYVTPAIIDSALIPSDTLSFCGEPLELVASLGQSWQWSTGDTTQNIFVNSAGIFSVTIHVNACFEKYEWYEVIPYVDTLSSSSVDSVYFCKEPIELIAPPGLSFHWSTGDTTASIIVGGTGTAQVIIKTAPCVNDTLNYFILSTPTSVYDFSLGNDTVICFSDSLKLKTPFANTVWSTGETGKEIFISSAGLFSASVTDTCTDELFTDSINVSQKICFCDPLFPNAFSPNGDGVNDKYAPIKAPECTYSLYSLQIFNRWGQVIFETGDPDEKWDGNFGKTSQPIDVYVYVCRYSLANQPEAQLLLKKGNVTLLR